MIFVVYFGSLSLSKKKKVQFSLKQDLIIPYVKWSVFQTVYRVSIYKDELDYGIAKKLWLPPETNRQNATLLYRCAITIFSIGQFSVSNDSDSELQTLEFTAWEIGIATCFVIFKKSINLLAYKISVIYDILLSQILLVPSRVCYWFTNCPLSLNNTLR